MAIVKADGGLTFYDGGVSILDSAGNLVARGLDCARYSDFIGERVEPWSYLTVYVLQNPRDIRRAFIGLDHWPA